MLKICSRAEQQLPLFDWAWVHPSCSLHLPVGPRTWRVCCQLASHMIQSFLMGEEDLFFHPSWSEVGTWELAPVGPMFYGPACVLQVWSTFQLPVTTSDLFMIHNIRGKCVRSGRNPRRASHRFAGFSGDIGWIFTTTWVTPCPE